MSTKKIEALTQKFAQINAQIEALKAKEKAEKRKQETRRKILIGGVVLKRVKEGEISEESLQEMLDKNLTNQRERDLFGLPEKAQP